MIKKIVMAYFFLFFHEEIYFSSFSAYMDVTVLFTIKKLLL